MNKLSDSELQAMKRKANIAARFEDPVVEKTIERDVNEYKMAVASGDEEEISKKQKRLEKNFAVVKEIISEHDYIRAILGGMVKHQIDSLKFCNSHTKLAQKQMFCMLQVDQEQAKH